MQRNRTQMKTKIKRISKITKMKGMLKNDGLFKRLVIWPHSIQINKQRRQSRHDYLPPNNINNSKAHNWKAVLSEMQSLFTPQPAKRFPNTPWTRTTLQRHPFTPIFKLSQYLRTDILDTQRSNSKLSTSIGSSADITLPKLGDWMRIAAKSLKVRKSVYNRAIHIVRKIAKAK